AEHERFDVGQLRARLGEKFARERLKSAPFLAQPEVALVQSGADRRGCDRDGGEEPLVAVAKQGAGAEPFGMIAKIVELAPGNVGDARNEVESAERLDCGTPAAHPLGPALTLVAEEQLV